MIPAQPHLILTPLVREYTRVSMRGHFASVRIHLEVPDATAEPTLLHATHVSWWDGYLALVVADRLGLDLRVMMLEHQLRRYAFLRFGGAFGFTPGQASSVREAIRYASGQLESRAASGQARAVAVFPAGEIVSSLRRPLPYRAGASSIALHASERASLNVRAVAWRLEHRGMAKPEVFIRVGAPRRAHPGSGLRGLTLTLKDDLEAITDALESDLRTGSLEAYAPALHGLPSAQQGWDLLRRAVGVRG